MQSVISVASFRNFDKPISCHWSFSISPENIRKLLVFWCIQGVETKTCGKEWVKANFPRDVCLRIFENRYRNDFPEHKWKEGLGKNWKYMAGCCMLFPLAKNETEYCCWKLLWKNLVKFPKKIRQGLFQQICRPIQLLTFNHSPPLTYLLKFSKNIWL